jgi:hypothetical protein
VPHSAAPVAAPRIVLPGGQVAPPAAFDGAFGNGGGFSGGERSSTSRGFIVFPTLDTSREINPSNRTEVMKKSRWLYNNDPLCKRFADGFARMMGWMMFQPATPDRQWNALVKRVALDLALSPQRFDRSGKFNFFTYQLLLSRLIVRDCDALNLATTGPDGGTQVLCVEAHQIANKVDRSADPAFFDGVRTDGQGKHRAYSVVDPRDPKKGKVYQAGRESHLAVRYERAGQNRGMSAFHAIVNSMLDTREIENDITLGIKTRNLIGFYMAPRDGGNDAPQLKGAKGLQTGLKQYRREVEYGTDDVAGEAEENLSYEEVFAGGNIPRMSDGFEPKVLESAQPHENEMAFLNWRVRKASLGFDIAPELLWDIGNLNGNTQRWLAADAQEMLEIRRMETLIPFCQWWWYHAIGAEIASGRMPEPVIPESMQNYVGWWSVNWIHPAKKTIDRGREGKLALDERRAMLRTLDEHFGEYQADWTQEAGQWLDEIVEIERMCRERSMPQWQIDAILKNLLAPPAGAAMPDSGSDSTQTDGPDPDGDPEVDAAK